MSDIPSIPRARATESTVGERLDSWKEIAAYLKREVRTVQRWEKKEGLPVRRHLHDKLGSVYAYKTELDAWWKDRQQVLQDEESRPDESSRIELESPEGEDAAAAARQSSSAHEPPSARFSKKAVGLLALSAVILIGTAYLVRRSVVLGTRMHPGKIKLVVLPFRNLSGDPAQTPFVDGLTAEMTTQLGRLNPESLGVIDPNTARQEADKSIEEIKSDLGADYILEGSVRHSGGRVRIDAQLFQASDQTNVWAENYDRELRDILALQADVAQAIAYKIQITLSPTAKALLAQTPPVNPDAFEAYVQGISYWNRRSPDSLQKSTEFFRQATQLDPNYSLAYASLATSYTLMTHAPNDVGAPKYLMPKAREAAKKALELDDSSAEAHAAVALVRQSYDWDWPGAEREYRRAFELNSAYASARQWYSLLLMALGRHQEAQAQIEMARQLDPLSTVIRSSYVQSLYFSREYDRVIDESKRTLALEPNFLLLRYHLGQAYVQTGRSAEAIEEFRQAKTLSGNLPVMVMALGHAYAVAGQKANALESIHELDDLARNRYVPPLYYAAIYTGLGDKRQAMDWLEKAFQQRTEYLIFLNVEPMADPLRADPRFQNLLRRIGLPHQSN